MDSRLLGKFCWCRRNIFFVLVTLGCVTTFYYYTDPMSTPYLIPDGENVVHMKNYLSRTTKHFGQQLRVDRSLSKDDIVSRAQKVATNFPIAFWELNKDRNLYYKNSSCARFPNVYHLKINNLYWQLLVTEYATFYLYSAYYDVRQRCETCPAIRLIGTIDRKRTNVTTYCQIWYPNSDEPLIVEASEYINLMIESGLTGYPILVTCPIPRELSGRAPIFVSLVEKMCDTATNSLSVVFDKPNAAEEKKKFAVCVKMLDFLHDDQSTRLIEWIELVRLLGADKILVYSLFVHENMTKVLKYYEELGVVELRQTTLVGNLVNLPHFQHLQLREHRWEQRWVNEVVQVNDCFYKNMYKYDFITMLDTDEVIMPHVEYNWPDLVKSVERKHPSKGDRASYESSMVIFPDCEDKTDVSVWYMLQHVLSDKDHILATPKSFFSTEMVITLHNHRATKCFGGNCNNLRMDRKEAELFHYRDSPYHESATNWPCAEMVKKNAVDTTIWRYREQLIDRTMVTLSDLGFFG